MAQPGPDALHVDQYAGGEAAKKRKRKEDGIVDLDTMALENVVLKRDFSTDERKKLASEDKALKDGSYPVPDADALRRAAILARSGHGDTSGAKALIGRRAKALGVKNPLAESTSKADGDPVSIDVKLIKGEYEGKVYGVVLEPDLEDSQGDIVDAPGIEKACHEHMLDALSPDVQHSGRDAGAVLIENYIAPVDFELATPDGTQAVRKGSWVQAYQVEDPVVKQEIADGKLTGFSIEGTGVRVPVAA